MVKAQYSSLTVDFKTKDKVINETNYITKHIKNIRTDIKVLILNQDINDDLVIISADLIWFSEELTNKIKSKLLDIFLIQNEKIFLCATHTHGSLQTDPEYNFGDFNHDYNELIINQLVEAVKVAKSKKLTDYKLKYGEAPIGPIAVNRRLYTLTLRLNEPFKRVQNRPNANKKYPDKIKTLSFHNEFDEPKLILLNFACHPLLDNVGETGRDYPGYVSDEIEKYFKSKTQFMFLQGFCGDISPRFVFKPKSIKDIFLEKLIGPKFKKPSRLEKELFVNNIKNSIINSLSNSNIIKIDKIQSSTFNLQLKNKSNQYVNRDLKISYLKLKKDLGIIFANAEMLYHFDFKQNDKNIYVGYTNGMAGYIAPKKEYKFKGYEVNGFLKRFNLQTEFNKNTENQYNSLKRFLISKNKKDNYFIKHWGEYHFKGWKINYAPKSYDIESIKKIINLIEQKKNKQDISNYLNTFTGNFSIIAKKGSQHFACVDSIRSYPIFYSIKNKSISYDPLLILDKLTFNNRSITELSMSSYVLDNKTLFKDIFQIRAGEMIFLPSFNKHQYFKFYPNKILNDNIHNLSKKLENITNTIIKRVIDKCEGKKILVPLSGGLDSRLVLSKLVENGCQNVEAVTYGIKNNGELLIAKKVAKKLNVKWTFVPTNNHESKQMFFSQKRKKYWDIASGYNVLPNMQEFHLMNKLNNQDKLKKIDVIVNGQAGDFITGGHLNHIFKNKKLNKENFLDIITYKNFNLWSDLVNETNLKNIKQQIYSSLKYYLDDKDKSFFNAYDSQLWEWSERQSKFVSNQQRVYEFFDLEWYLPLWDREYIDFWMNCPSDLLINQKLYKYYLEKWDFKNLFTDKKLKRAINPWIGNKKIFIIFANIIKIFLNNAYKEEFYKYVKYFNHYSNHYHSYSLLYFLKRAKFIRNHTSLNVETYVSETIPDNNIFIDR